jgi:hypothetical protein
VSDAPDDQPPQQPDDSYSDADFQTRPQPGTPVELLTVPELVAELRSRVEACVLSIFLVHPGSKAKHSYTFAEGHPVEKMGLAALSYENHLGRIGIASDPNRGPTMGGGGESPDGSGE